MRRGRRRGSASTARAPTVGRVTRRGRDRPRVQRRTPPGSSAKGWSSSATTTARGAPSRASTRDARTMRVDAVDRRPSTLAARGGVQPVVPAVPPVAAGLARHRRRRSALPLPPGRARGRRPRRRGARLRPRGRSTGVMRTLRARRSPPGRRLLRALDTRARRRAPTSSPPRRPCCARALARAGPRRAIASSPSATPTSTPRGCGRSARRVRKCVRTFASAVRLMDDYPEYRFACSQAQQYAWIEERRARRCSTASPTRSPAASGSRSAACGSRPT